MPFDAEVEYRCTNGMRSAADLGFVSQVATCRPGNLWEAPNTWESCTPSKIRGHSDMMSALKGGVRVVWEERT